LARRLRGKKEGLCFLRGIQVTQKKLHMNECVVVPRAKQQNDVHLACRAISKRTRGGVGCAQKPFLLAVTHCAMFLFAAASALGATGRQVDALGAGQEDGTCAAVSSWELPTSGPHNDEEMMGSPLRLNFHARKRPTEKHWDKAVPCQLFIRRF
jgi:hypothetical protein